MEIDYKTRQDILSGRFVLASVATGLAVLPIVVTAAVAKKTAEVMVRPIGAAVLAAKRQRSTR